MPIMERYWAKIDVRGPDECWPWTGARHSDGRGRFFDGTYLPTGHGRYITSTRWGYEQLVGPIPAGHLICHSCDNPSCQNPAHWFTGTPADNSRDMVAKNRQTSGERNGRAKLTEGQVDEIRRRYAAGGVTQAALAHEFAVSRALIGFIVHRVNWK